MHTHIKYIHNLREYILCNTGEPQYFFNSSIFARKREINSRNNPTCMYMCPLLFFNVFNIIDYISGLKIELYEYFHVALVYKIIFWKFSDSEN